MNHLKRFWNWLKRWFVDPAALPEELGTKAGIKKHRPIPIELGFMLHADGKVYFRNRQNHTLVRCGSDEICRLVYHEYNVMVEMGRKEQEKTEAKAKRRKKTARVFAKTKSPG